MKLYFKNTEIKNIIKNELLKTSITNKSMFYSNEGIFTIEKDNIYRIDYINDEIINYKNFLNHMDAISDNTLINKERVFQLPNKHHQHIYKEYVIKTAPNAEIALVIEETNDIISDHYFLLNNNDIHNQFIKDDIIKLLSYIK
jgi:hypothetical protein